ncbi:hypothetical protein KDA_64550 [Dictyobacter alpinus]|uniref:Uncharacterized protein n=1 Tax=Dictyobacter alpinus TaxID=2014873 RepID=A0A402BHS8_9CHLR|nr:hypothetical protein KDA_64550 [Dictyobacter alpinus]
MNNNCGRVILYGQAKQGEYNPGALPNVLSGEYMLNDQRIQDIPDKYHSSKVVFWLHHFGIGASSIEK